MSVKSVVWLIVLVVIGAFAYYFVMSRFHPKMAPTQVSTPAADATSNKVIALEGDFKQVVLAQAGAVVVDFSASWCPMCNMMEPIVQAVAQLPEFATVKFVSVNVDKYKDVATEYGVSAIPTFVFFKDGKQIDSQIGGLEQDAMVKKIKAIFAL
jgi:thioredoxin 1